MTQCHWRERATAWLRPGAILLSSLLGGCGGGTTGTTAAPPPVNPIATPSVPASPALPKAAAQLKATYQPDTRRTVLEWTDVLDNEQRYALQRSNGTQWVTVQQIDPQAGQGQPMQTPADLPPGSLIRVIADTPQGTMVLATANQGDTLTVAGEAAALALDVGGSSPLSGLVRVSISGLTRAVAVQYLLDLRQQARISSGSGYAWSWSTAGVTDGTHLLQAVIETSPSSFVELRREVVVDNPNVSLSLSAQNNGSSTAITVGTSSINRSIAQVSLSVDGTPAGTLTDRNACASRFCDGTLFDVYQFSLDHAALGHGRHVVHAVVIDSAGESRSADLSVLINSPPSIELALPASGTVLGSDSLRIQGAARDDDAGVRVQIRVGDVTLPHNGSASFDLSYPLTGLPNGSYKISVTATDSDGVVRTLERSLIRQVGSIFSYTPVLTLGSTGELLSVRGQELLIKQGSTVLWQRPQGSITLQQADVLHASFWQLSPAGVSTYGVGNGWPFQGGPGYETYFWGPDGQRRSLSAEAGSRGGFDEHVTASGDWQLWSTRTPGLGYFLLNTRSGQVERIALPAGTSYQGNWQFGLSAGSSARAYYWAALSSSTPQAYAVYRYDSATGQSVRLSPAGNSWRDIYVQTDGQRVAWQRNASSASIDPPYSLMVADIGNDLPASAISTTMTQFKLADGVLAWVENSGDVYTLKVSTGGQTIVLTQRSSAPPLIDVGGGAVLYGTSEGLWIWSAAAGSRLLLSVTGNGGPRLTPDGLYLILGEERTVVRVTGW